MRMAVAALELGPKIALADKLLLDVVLRQRLYSAGAASLFFGRRVGVRFNSIPEEQTHAVEL